MVECLLCLQSDHEIEKCIQVDSSEWKEFDIKKLIDKHLWSIDTIKENSWLCSPCCEELKDFHKFYNRIEEAHDNLKSWLKSESPFGDDDKSKDLQLEMLLEPEIIIGQTLDNDIVIKQENDEPIVELSPTVTIKDKTNKGDKVLPDPDLDDDVDDSDDSDSDYEMSFDNRIETETKSKSKAKDDVSGGNDGDSEANSESDSDPLHPTDESKKKNSKRKCSAVDKPNMSCKSYYTPKTNRLEHDKFLQEHYKITCNKCSQPFDTFPLLCKHYSIEHNERGFVTCCERKFYDRSLLVDHINYHLNPEYFKCKECGKVVTNRRCLNAHMKQHQEKQFQCNVCQRKFIDKTKLERHKLTHLSKEERKHPCNECGKFFANEVILRLHHRAVHLSIYAKVCELCGQTMPDTSSFKNHMAKHEMKSEMSSVKCEECGLILAGPMNLKIHCDLQHPPGGKRDYSCHICPKVSPTLRALKKHIRCAHEMGYDFKCTMCEKAFKRSDNLKAHMSTHTGTPLFRCPWCPKTFNSNGNMHSHRKKAHPIEWEEARRRKYSGNLPPNYKPPATNYSCQYSP